VTFDPKCYDLAAEFLEDWPHLETTERTNRLAEAIQEVIDKFIRHEHDNYEPPDPPGWEGGFCDNH
jgi:hypothetical protein